MMKGDPHMMKIGNEGFGLLEQIFPSRYPYPGGVAAGGGAGGGSTPPGQLRPLPEEGSVLNDFQAAQKYGGMVFLDPAARTRKPGQHLRK